MRLYLYMLICAVCIAFGSCAKDEALNGEDNNALSLADEDEDNFSGTITDEYVYKLPVIFHVLYADKNDITQYVEPARLQTIINRVNDLFQGNIYGESEALNVQFVLANYDEKGNRLKNPGVDYVQWTGSYPIDVDAFMKDETKKYAKYLWEPNDYINIFLYHFKQPEIANASITLGISHLPYVIKGDSTLEGVNEISTSSLTKANLTFPYGTSINSTYINKESSRYTQADKGKNGFNYDSRDINLTLAHELGHYLGLHHVFTDKDGEPVDSCGDTDYCKDTPSYNKVEYDDFVKGYLAGTSGNNPDANVLIRRTNCSNEQFRSTNIMDYAVGLGYQFTADQKARVRQVLYYSPLIPGPKKNRTTRPTRAVEGIVKLPINTVK